MWCNQPISRRTGRFLRLLLLNCVGTVGFSGAARSGLHHRTGVQALAWCWFLILTFQSCWVCCCLLHFLLIQSYCLQTSWKRASHFQISSRNAFLYCNINWCSLLLFDISRIADSSSHDNAWQISVIACRFYLISYIFAADLDKLCIGDEFIKVFYYDPACEILLGLLICCKIHCFCGRQLRLLRLWRSSWLLLRPWWKWLRWHGLSVT